MKMKIQLKDGLWYKSHIFKEKLESLGFLYGDHVLEIQEWSIFKKLREFLDDSKIEAIIVDDISLSRINKEFSGLRYCKHPKNGEIIWKGEDAVFIFNNLSCSGYYYDAY